MTKVTILRRREMVYRCILTDCKSTVVTTTTTGFDSLVDCRKESVRRKRRRRIMRHARGFVYLVSVTGVTGTRTMLPRTLVAWIRRVKGESALPVCVGFGISNAGQVREISRAADGIIVGSALVEIIERAATTREMIRNVHMFVSRLRSKSEAE